MKARLFPCLLLLLVISFSGKSLSATTFSTNALISELDPAFDGQDIVVSGATLTVDGRHYFTSLLLTNGAVLTHSPCTTTTTHKLDLVVTNDLVVSTNSKIDVSGKGYLPKYTTGNTTNGGIIGSSGTSFGGVGGAYGGTPNPVYGDYSDPDDWGSGGGETKGGGLVRIRAQALILEGKILADGETATVRGGASGGGVSLDVDVLASWSRTVSRSRSIEAL